MAQRCAAGSNAAGLAKTISTNWASRSAMKTFLNRPRTNRCRPSVICSGVGRGGVAICGRNSTARTIGPAASLRFRSADEQPGPVVDNGWGEQDPEVPRVPRDVEEPTRHEQQAVLGGARAEGVIADEDGRQKREEGGAGEVHGAVLDGAAA